MKFLQEYMEDRQTALFNETGSFFAFSMKQFNEAKKEGINYIPLGAGLICPEDTAIKLIEGLDTIYKESIAQDIKENGAEAIIAREIFNHECHYTGDYEPMREKLADYNFAPELLNKVIREERIKYINSDQDKF